MHPSVNPYLRATQRSQVYFLLSIIHQSELVWLMCVSLASINHGLFLKPVQISEWG